MDDTLMAGCQRTLEETAIAKCCSCRNITAQKIKKLNLKKYMKNNKQKQSRRSMSMNLKCMQMPIVLDSQSQNGKVGISSLRIEFKCHTIDPRFETNDGG